MCQDLEGRNMKCTHQFFRNMQQYQISNYIKYPDPGAKYENSVYLGLL